MAGFAETGRYGSVKVEGQRTGQASQVAIIEEVKGLKNTLKLHPLAELESLRRTEIQREEFVIQPLRISLHDIRERSAIFD